MRRYFYFAAGSALFAAGILYQAEQQNLVGLLRKPANQEEAAGKRSSFIPSPTELPVMNGIDPKVADRFWEKWHFVTTRFRQDNLETRIVYANSIAWKAMIKRSPTYPDGAMFAKAVFDTALDHAFPSSSGPKIYRELELMKKDSIAYPDTDGWGYAVYEYKEYPQELRQDLVKEPKTLMQTCHSCHSVVKNRDFVFSMPAFLQWHLFDPQLEAPLLKSSFVAVSSENLSEFENAVVTRHGGSKFRKIMVFAVPSFLWGQRLAVHSLAKFSREEGVPFLMRGQTPLTFLITLPMKDKTSIANDAGECVRFGYAGRRQGS